MILSALAFTLATQVSVPGVELVEPNARRIVVQAWVKPPFEMKATEAAAWHVMAECLLRGAGSYSEPQIRQYGGQYGILPKVEAFSDLIKIEMIFPPEGMSVAGELLEEIVTEATLRDSDVEEAAKRLQNRSVEVWDSALMPDELPYDKVTGDLVRNLYDITFRRPNLVIGAGGVFEQGELGSKVLERSAREDRAPRRTPAQFENRPFPAVRRLQRISTFELQGQPLLPSTSSFAPRLAAMYALGGGKSSTAFRVLRQQLGLSYQQDAFLWPSSRGWIPRIIVARRSNQDDEKVLDQMTAALLADIEKWDAATLARAKTAAKMAFGRGEQTQVIWMGKNRPISGSLSDRLALRCWLELVGAGSASLDLVLKTMENVELETLKAEAKLMIEESNGSIILGV